MFEIKFIYTTCQKYTKFIVFTTLSMIFFEIISILFLYMCLNSRNIVIYDCLVKCDFWLNAENYEMNFSFLNFYNKKRGCPLRQPLS